MPSRRHYNHESDYYDYGIETFADFQELQLRINNGTEGQSVRFPGAVNGDGFAGKIFKMLNDVDFANYAWTGIGIYTSATVYKAFKGVFNGGRCSIFNFKLSSSTGSSTGLFNVVENAIVKKLNISTSTAIATTAQYCYMSLFGTALGSVLVCEIVYNVSVSGSINWGGLVVNVVNGANLHIHDVFCTLDYVAGLRSSQISMAIGYVNSTGSVVIERCSLFADINGLTGSTQDCHVGVVANRVTGNVNLSIRNCYYFGNINTNYGNTYRDSGGMVGTLYNIMSKHVEMTNCVAIGQVLNGKGNYGLLATFTPDSYNGCYYLSTLLPGTLFNGDPKTAAELQSGSLFADGVWIERPGKFPVLPFRIDLQDAALNQ